MRTKLLRKLRKKSENIVRVYRDSIFPDKYQIRQMHPISDDYKILETTSDIDEAKKICDGYRRGYILLKVREYRFGEDEARDGRVY